MKRIFTILAGMVAIVMSFQMPVFAAGTMDTNKKAQLTVYLHSGRAKPDGAEFSIYKTASIRLKSGAVTYEKIAPYDLDSVVYENMTETQSKEAALEFAQIPADAAGKGTTGLTGRTTFTGLDAGIYLVKETGKSSTAADYEAAEPFLVMVPSYNAARGSWSYDVTASPKTEPRKAEKPKKPVTEQKAEAHQKETGSPTYVDYVPTGDTPALLAAAGAATTSATMLIMRRRKRQH